MNFMLEALKIVDKAYLFDNSSDQPVLFATYENNEITISDTDHTPTWFFKYVINKL